MNHADGLGNDGGVNRATRSPWPVVLASVAVGVLVLVAGISWGRMTSPSADFEAVTADEAKATLSAANALSDRTGSSDRNSSGTRSQGATGDSDSAASAGAFPTADTGGLSVGLVREDEASVGSTAPAFSVETPSGGTLALADYSGRPIVLNFFATWCTPCRIEMPHFQAAHTEYADLDLTVIGMDVQEEPEVVPPFLEELGLTFPVGLDRDGSVRATYRVRTLPTTFFIDREGVIATMRPGMFASREDLDASLRYILPELAAEGR